MSFHLCVYSAGSVSASTYTQLNAVSDPAMTQSSNAYLMDQPRQALFAYAAGATLNRAIITSPTLAINYSPAIRPVQAVSVVPDNPNVALFLESPIILPAREGIQINVINGGSERDYACIAAQAQNVPAARGPIKILRASATTACSANTYTQVTLTYDNTLQAGSYDIVSAEVFNATGVFYRLLVQGQADRPGGVCNTNIAHKPNMFFSTRFPFGSWGSFTETTLPQLEVFCYDVTAATVLNLYLVKKS